MTTVIALATVLVVSMTSAAAELGGADELADQYGLDPAQLQAAADTVGTDPHTYLVGEGVIRPPLNPALEARLNCVARFESNNTPSATNRQSGAAGLFQFLGSTWRTTPQGRAGLSPYDPAAARDAARWMFLNGRAREWVAVTAGGC